MHSVYFVARWRIFGKPIIETPERVEKYTLAAIALHSYVRQTDMLVGR